MTVLDDFAALVGPRDPVTPTGSRTQWSIGGVPADGAREVRAPAGVVSFEPGEMVVRVRAGTTIGELDAAVRAAGQRVVLDGLPAAATVGGALAVGHSPVGRLRDGPLRDAVLGVTFVTAAGRLARSGGAVVKNVSGFDLCRLLVGSLGTLGVLAEVVLRTQPRPAGSLWLRGAADPWTLRGELHDPVAVLWDGTTTWVGVAGHPGDVADEARRAARAGCAEEVPGPPVLPPHRWSVVPGAVADLAGDGIPFVAEIGVGTVHRPVPQPPRPAHPRLAALHREVKARFDPTGRLNPGRHVGPA